MGGFGTPGHLGSSGLIWDQLDRLNPSSPSEASALTASIDLGQSALRPARHSPRRAFFLRGIWGAVYPFDFKSRTFALSSRSAALRSSTFLAGWRRLH